jgi:hypothetical protein
MFRRLQPNIERLPSTPAARRQFIARNIRGIYVPRPGGRISDLAPRGSAILGMPESGGICAMIVSDAAHESDFSERLRKSAFMLRSDMHADRRVYFALSEVERVGDYDMTLHRIERIQHPDMLAGWLGGEPMPMLSSAHDTGHMSRLMRDVVRTLGLDLQGGPDKLRLAMKRISFLAEDYAEAGLHEGADELAALAIVLETMINRSGGRVPQASLGLLRRCESIGSAESRHESYQALATLRSSEKSINSQILSG